MPMNSHLFSALVTATRATLEASESSVLEPKSAHREVKQRKRAVYHQCSFCGKKNGDKLRACSLCRSSRYCDAKCQHADYKRRHRQECKEFVYPPFTIAFLTEPVGDKGYARNPVFARGYSEKDGVGLWVSIRDQIEIWLDSLAAPMRAMSFSDELGRRLQVSTDAETTQKYRTDANNILTLVVLVQNRRKDKKPVVVFGAHSQLLSFANNADVMLKGMTDMDRYFTFEHHGTKFASVGVANNYSDNNPRMCVTNINGTDIAADGTSSAILDPERMIVRLDPGQYVILQMQFRIGDGDTIRRCWQALCQVSMFCLPYIAPWPDDGAHTTLDKELTSYFRSDARFPLGISAPFDTDAVMEYYRDLIEKNERAFVESHHGTEQAERLERTHRMMEEKGREMLEMIDKYGGGLQELTEHCRRAGNTQMLYILEDMRRAGRIR